MLRIGRHSTGAAGLAAWPALLCLALGVLAPSAALVWFMHRAVQNEDLAFRQKLEQSYRTQLQLHSEKAAGIWNSKIRQVEALRGEFSGSSLFAQVITRGVADGFAAEGFPAVHHTVAATDPLSELDEAARELQASAREARIAGSSAEAARRFFELGGQPFENARDAQGRLVAPYADLAFLEIAPIDEPLRAIVADRLQRRANYSNTNMPGPQRRFLIPEAGALRKSTNAPILQAEHFTLSALERLAPASSGVHAQPELGWVAIRTNGLVLILRDEKIRQELDRALRGASADFNLAVLGPAADEKAARPAIASASIPEFPGWRLVAALKDADEFRSGARRQIAVYLWVSGLVLGAVAIASLATARLLLRQSRVARLKNDLLANVTHELKTPLASTRVLVETLLDSPTLNEKTTREYLGLIARENRRLTGLIENFLAFSRMERNKFTFDLAPASAAEIAQRAAEAVRERFAAEQVQFAVQISEDLPEIQADADSLETALLNLLENALKYSEHPRRIGLRAFARDGHAVFEVRDNGIGIPARERKRIFERFYQVDQTLSRPAGGCGLGLSIVEFIVRAHGGAVRVESEPGQGSTFSVELPAHRHDLQPEAAL